MKDDYPEKLLKDEPDEFWEGKNVVVTGGCGTIGHKVVLFLLNAGANVTVVDDMSRGFVTIKGAAYYNYDAGEPYLLRAPFRYADAVFNLAASVGGIYHNLNHQFDQFYRNMRLQVVPVQMAAKAGVPLFLQVSSVCIYGPEHNNPAVENRIGDTVEKSNEGYAWAKRMGEKASLFLADKFEKLVIVRPTNAYGEADEFGEKAHVIPAIIKKMSGPNLEVKIYGGYQRREFIYTDDLARGMMEALKGGYHGDTYNLGTSGTTVATIQEVAKIIRYKMGKGRIQVKYVKGIIGDPARSTNSKRARNHFGWRATTPLDIGIEKTVKWYKEYYGFVPDYGPL